MEPTREAILEAMRRTTELNGGRPLGQQRFQRTAGITEYAWHRFWARYSDLQRDAGYAPNTWSNPPFDTDMVIEKYVAVVRHLGKLPTEPELRIWRSTDPAFPSVKVFRRVGGNKRGLVAIVAAYCAGKPDYADVAAICTAETRTERLDGDGQLVATGFVYLVRGRQGEYKIGRTNQLDRRVNQLGTSSAVELGLVHQIETDDPAGVETYWHRRFEPKRLRGEWFKLSAAEVAAFRRWKRIA